MDSRNGTGTQLKSLVQSPRLVVLATCASARTGEGDALFALGPSLAETGVPAVLARQGDVTMDTVARFMPVFFAELRHDGQIDRAAAVARGAVRNRFDYWMPTLFMRSESGQLWDVPDESADWQNLYVPPDMVFKEVHIGEFTGRAWLADKVDAFLNDPKRQCGVFLLQGEAGVGKTAFMAHFVHERNGLHLFARQFTGQANLLDVIKSLAAQIISRYRIVEYARRDTIEQLASTPNFLYNLLNLASAKRQPGQPIVIGCDGLDEAGIGNNGNPFGLPPVLPEGVCLLLAQRPDSTHLDFKDGWQKQMGERTRAEALSGLAPHLPEPLKVETLQAARTIQGEEARAKALSGLAPHLPETLKGEALQAARVIRDEEARANALSGLAPHLPEAFKGEALGEALQAAKEVGIIESWTYNMGHDFERSAPVTQIISLWAEIDFAGFGDKMGVWADLLHTCARS